MCANSHPFPLLRDRLVRIIEEYLQKNSRAAARTAMDPFYLMSSDLVVVPTPYVARNLQEFADGLRKVSVHAIYYHFIDARLRLKLNSNDFSVWLERNWTWRRPPTRSIGAIFTPARWKACAKTF